MIKLDLFFGVVSFALLVYCLIECISTPEQSVRNLPKIAWVFLILLFPLVGSIAWLAAGRPEYAAPRSRMQGASPSYPEYDRPGRMAAGDESRDEEFLKQVRARADEQRRRYEAEKKRQSEEE